MPEGKLDLTSLRGVLLFPGLLSLNSRGSLVTITRSVETLPVALKKAGCVVSG